MWLPPGGKSLAPRAAANETERELQPGEDPDMQQHF